MRTQMKFPFLPSAEQELLIRAAVLPADEARRCWNEWNSRVNIEDIDHASFRLLASIFSNLRGNPHDLDDALGRRIKGVYKLNWVRNQRLLQTASLLLKGFERLGVPVLLLKGTALLTQKLMDPGARIIGDLDFLIPVEHVTTGMRAVQYLGWKPYHPRYAIDPYCAETQNYIDVMYSVDYKRYVADGGPPDCVDLHWRPLPPYYVADHGEDYWVGARPVELPGARALVPSPATQLFHACVHATQWTLYGEIYWIVDAMRILGALGSQIDWDQFLQMARCHNVARPLQTTLSYLKHGLAAPLPDPIMKEINRLPASPLRRLAFHLTSRYPGGGLGLYPHMFRWKGGPLDFLLKYFALDSKWECLRPRHHHNELYNRPGPRRKTFNDPDAPAREASQGSNPAA